MTDVSLTYETVATPKTNAVARFVKNEHGDWVDTVPTEFARIQERRIAELTALLQRCVDPVSDMLSQARHREYAYRHFEERKKRCAAEAQQYDTLLSDIQKATQP